MKKTAAILFLVAHLLASTCYSFVFSYFINLSDTQLVQHLDADNYKDADLVEISMPLNMPYIINSNGYERYDGQIEFNGRHYNYVKRKVSNDTLYILCLPNMQKSRLCAAKNEYAKQLSDAPSPNKNNEPAAKKSMALQEYNNCSTQYDFTALHSFLPNRYGTIFIPHLKDCFIETAGKPPQATA